MSTTTNTAVKATTSTKKSASRPACFTKDVWDRSTYKAYFALIDVVKGTKSMKDFTKEPMVKYLCTKLNITMGTQNMVSLIAYMVNYGTKDHEKVCKVNALSFFRKWFNEGYKELVSRPVVSNAGKVNPFDKKSPKGKAPTKADLEAQNAELLKELAALREQLAA